MDPPTQESAPISIITVLDKNIQYFSKEIADLSDKITRAKSRENLKAQLENDKFGLEKLLQLNQSCKQQQLLDLEKLNTTLKDLAPLVEQSKNLPPITPTDHTHQFTYPEVTRFPIDADQLVQNTENRIMHRVDEILQNQGSAIVTEAEKVHASYLHKIKQLTKENEQNKLLLAESERKLKQEKRNLVLIVPLFTLCVLFAINYILPQ